MRTIPYRSDQNFTSEVIIDGQTVTKRIVLTQLPGYGPDDLRKLAVELFEREVFWLKLLTPFDVCPAYMDSDRERLTITMAYAGERVTEHNRPEDLEAKLLRISQILSSVGCHYNDWKLANILLGADKRIRLCDFGWCPLIQQDYTLNNRIESILTSKPGGEQWIIP